MSTSKKQEVQVSSYSRRLKDNVKSILDNYSEILKSSKASSVVLIMSNDVTRATSTMAVAESHKGKQLRSL